MCRHSSKSLKAGAACGTHMSAIVAHQRPRQHRLDDWAAQRQSINKYSTHQHAAAAASLHQHQLVRDSSLETFAYFLKKRHGPSMSLAATPMPAYLRQRLVWRLSSMHAHVVVVHGY